MSRTTFPAHNLYETLGVSRSASTVEIRKAYRELCLTNHPDKAGSTSTATARFVKIKEAYEILGNPDARRQHDDHASSDARGSSHRHDDTRDRASAQALIRKRILKYTLPLLEYRQTKVADNLRILKEDKVAILDIIEAFGLMGDDVGHKLWNGLFIQIETAMTMATREFTHVNDRLADIAKGHIRTTDEGLPKTLARIEGMVAIMQCAALALVELTHLLEEERFTYEDVMEQMRRQLGIWANPGNSVHFF
ncbi:Uu.00g075170.m01.CDS01 [Anthostomella pinea]|uniref:Uu.00g075170.m01.CDS01 n=1 Tax=Anthostomella pinea TaxID=933095 RepID=A0AAI8VVM0_9PEZI|nr:Uu.00g075170.m01.CDS01 [Anthostomella pinea]